MGLPALARIKRLMSLSLQLLEPIQHHSNLPFACSPACGRRLSQADDAISVRHKVETTFHAPRRVEEPFFDDGRRAEGKGRARRRGDAHESCSRTGNVYELLAVGTPHRMVAILGTIRDLVLCTRLWERLD